LPPPTYARQAFDRPRVDVVLRFLPFVFLLGLAAYFDQRNPCGVNVAISHLPFVLNFAPADRAGAHHFSSNGVVTPS
jgi:hypothetical protein